jgi:hypothetical protein
MVLFGGTHEARRDAHLNNGVCRRRGDGGSRGDESDSSVGIADDEDPDAADRAWHLEHEVPFVSLGGTFELGGCDFTRVERRAATCGTCQKKFSAFASARCYSKIWSNWIATERERKKENTRRASLREREKEREARTAQVKNDLAQVHSYNHRALGMHGTTCAAKEARRREDVARDAERASWGGEISQTAAFGTREVTVTFSRCLVGPEEKKGCKCGECGAVLSFATQSVCIKHIKAKHAPAAFVAEAAADDARKEAEKSLGSKGKAVMNSFFTKSKARGALDIVARDARKAEIDAARNADEPPPPPPPPLARALPSFFTSRSPAAKLRTIIQWNSKSTLSLGGGILNSRKVSRSSESCWNRPRETTSRRTVLRFRRIVRVVDALSDDDDREIERRARSVTLQKRSSESYWNRLRERDVATRETSWRRTQTWHDLDFYAAQAAGSLRCAGHDAAPAHRLHRRVGVPFGVQGRRVAAVALRERADARHRL